MEADKPFRFLDLPAEIRNRVYGLALHENTASIQSYKEQKRVLGSTCSSSNKTCHARDAVNRAAYALIHANSQIRSEAICIFYLNTTFVFFQPARMIAWLSRLPAAHKSLVKALRYESGASS